MPSCEQMFDPQHFTPPVAVTAHAWEMSTSNGPMMKYLELRSGLEITAAGLRYGVPYHETFDEFLPTFFTRFDRLTWGHLWFLAYLFTLSLVWLPLYRWLIRRPAPADVSRDPAVVVGTPGRLCDHLERGALDLSAARAVVLDEADQMLDLGFREALELLLGALPETCRKHLVSATFPRAVLALADRYQQQALVVGGGDAHAAHADIRHVAHLVSPRERYGALVNVLLLDPELRSLILKTVGPEPLLRAALAEVDGIEEVFIYGSWADPAEMSPADIDLLVVGEPDVGEIYDAVSAVEAEVGRPINVTVRTAAEWAEADGAFERSVKSGPRIDLR